jgi:hypothetical protein
MYAPSTDNELPPSVSPFVANGRGAIAANGVGARMSIPLYTMDGYRYTPDYSSRAAFFDLNPISVKFGIIDWRK